ncbi:MAG: tRNA pseudouridine(55) synthase TruB [Clostridium sp.]|jgi:tRNA pseudouridine55 synthase
MNGVLNIFKNKGMTSFDVVSRVRKIAKEKKVGHTGTLDPEAEGVLPVCLGKGTKIIDYIMNSEKGYSVKFKLGIKTTTYDLEGEILEERDTSFLKEEEVKNVINSFKGEYLQVPPMFSALKKNGVRLYELARKGIEVEREGRNITIYNIENINIDLPYVSMDVTCSKGTYIRSLCYDIGEKLNVFATMTDLKRFKTSFFCEEDSININDLKEENIKEKLISIEDALKNYPKIYIEKGYTKLIVNGVRVGDKRFTKDFVENNVLYRVYGEDKEFLGLGKKNEEGFKMEKLLIG